MEKIKVLLADDHQVLREGIRMLLTRAPDIEIVGEASNGEEAVAKVKELHPNVVLMDITMPGMNGLEATGQIKQFAPDTRVLILTVHETDQYLSQMLEVGAAGYLVKTAGTSELLSAIRAVYQGNAYLYPSIANMLIRDYLKNSGVRQENLPGGLTAREMEILKYISEDLKNKDIASKLGISVRTVQAHRTSLMQKLGAHDRTQLVKYAIREGLISP